MTQKYEVINYLKNGKDILKDWLNSLKDINGKIAIDRRIIQMRNGNFGNHKFCRDGVWELVINVSAGYRVYYSMIGNTIVLLLCAGSKRTQDKDIEKAIMYLKDFKEKNKNV